MKSVHIHINNFYNKVTQHGNGFQALEWRHDARLRRDICEQKIALFHQEDHLISNFIRELKNTNPCMGSSCRQFDLETTLIHCINDQDVREYHKWFGSNSLAQTQTDRQTQTGRETDANAQRDTDNPYQQLRFGIERKKFFG